MSLTDWIQAFSTAAVAVLTVVLCRLTTRYAAANERMAHALERDLRERYRAWLDR